MHMILRRTCADDPVQDVEVPRAIDVAALHTLLHQRGAADLAAVLLQRRPPEGAHDLATLLARFRCRYSTPGLFRSYRRLLDADEARSIDLAVAFLLGAAHAGCRVYLDPGPIDVPMTPVRPCLVRPSRRDAERDDPLGQSAPPDDAGDEPSGPQGIMPPWLTGPHGSVWDR